MLVRGTCVECRKSLEYRGNERIILRSDSSRCKGSRSGAILLGFTRTYNGVGPCLYKFLFSVIYVGILYRGKLSI